MPETAEALGFGFGFDNLGNKREIVDAIGEQVTLERTEALRKVIVFLWRQVLVAEKDNLVIEKRLVELMVLFVTELSG